MPRPVRTRYSCTGLDTAVHAKAQTRKHKNTGAVGIMIAVALTFGRDLMADWRDLVVFAMAGVMVWKFPKTSSVWLVLGGSSIGYLLRLTG